MSCMEVGERLNYYWEYSRNLCGSGRSNLNDNDSDITHLSEALHRDQVAAVTFAKVWGLLPGVSDVEELIAVDAVKLPLSWKEKIYRKK